MNVNTKSARHVLRLGLLCNVMFCAAAETTLAAEPAQDAAGEKVTRIACVGDSITFGAGIADRAANSYPALLSQWLGTKWEVRNFGASGATLLKKGNLPYWKRPHFQQALAFKPDVVTILLGTNDSKHGSPNNPKIADNWQHKAEFSNDYKALVREFKKVNPNLKVYLGLPAPAFSPNRYGIDGAIIEKEIVPLVRQVAAQSEAEIIDLHTPLSGKPELSRDRVHPNEAGTRLIAATIYRTLTGREAPLNSETAKMDKPIAPQPVAVTQVVPLSVTLPPNKENFHLYLLMGQSNMVGRDTRTLALQLDNPRVLAFNGDGQWVVAREPMHVGGTGIGPGIPFALEMLKTNPDAAIGLIPCAVGGTSLGRWVKGADLYEKAVSRTKLVVPSGTLKGVLWHQGESDTSYPSKAEVYGARLSRMLNDLRSDLGSPHLPIVVGQIGEFLAESPEKYPHAAAVRAAIKNIPTTVPHVGFADSNGLSHKGDKLHFSAEAENQMGVRFAQAMQQLQAAPPVKTP